MSLRTWLRLLTLAWFPTLVLLLATTPRWFEPSFDGTPYLGPALLVGLVGYAAGLVWMWRIAGSVEE
jgi:hypothetical protein